MIPQKPSSSFLYIYPPTQSKSSVTLTSGDWSFTMGRPRFRLKLKLRSLCIARASPCVRLFSSSSFRPSQSSSSASVKYGDVSEFQSMKEDVGEKGEEERGNKIMVVVDSTLEAQGALDWALSHAVQAHDTVLLLHVAKPTTPESTGKLNQKVYQLLLDMKNMCEIKRPRVQVKIMKVERKEKGGAIVEEAKQQSVSLLVIGQRKRSIFWCFWQKWGRKTTTSSASVVADYCIRNASCIAIAVRRKNKRLGGYLITTKRHKNFWLLA